MLTFSFLFEFGDVSIPYNPEVEKHYEMRFNQMFDDAVKMGKNVYKTGAEIPRLGKNAYEFFSRPGAYIAAAAIPEFNDDMINRIKSRVPQIRDVPNDVLKNGMSDAMFHHIQNDPQLNRSFGSLILGTNEPVKDFIYKHPEKAAELAVKLAVKNGARAGIELTKGAYKVVSGKTAEDLDNFNTKFEKIHKDLDEKGKSLDSTKLMAKQVGINVAAHHAPVYGKLDDDTKKHLNQIGKEVAENPRNTMKILDHHGREILNHQINKRLDGKVSKEVLDAVAQRVVNKHIDDQTKIALANKTIDELPHLISNGKKYIASNVNNAIHDLPNTAIGKELKRVMNGGSSSHSKTT